MPDNRGTAALKAFAPVKAFGSAIHAVAPVIVAVSVIAGSANINSNADTSGPSAKINIFC